jgi:hypothetical protein
MAKKLTSKSSEKTRDVPKTVSKNTIVDRSSYLFSMHMAPSINQSFHWFQLIPAAFFTAIIIMITKMKSYERPMDKFYWSDGATQLTDFFSYYKMCAIIACAILVLVIFLYKIFTQSLAIKKSIYYIPMLIYTLLVLLSYAFSSYKEFSYLGFNDRFEGTLPIVGYMVMLFYIINVIRSERDVKWIIYPVAVSSAILGLLGMSQALGHDFFRTSLGKKLITPSWFWDRVDSLSFTFQHNEIYQTVYNINYVSFYLTLLLPLFGMLFIRSCSRGKDEPLWEKILLGALFALLVFNLIGSASSGGLAGIAVVILIGIIVLNKKIIEWIKPIMILVLITVIIGGISYNRWFPEFQGAINGVLGTNQIETSNPSPEAEKNVKIDLLDTYDASIIIGVQNEKLAIVSYPKDPKILKIVDGKGDKINLTLDESTNTYSVDDPRFNMVKITPTTDQGMFYLVVTINGQDFPFAMTDSGPLYRNPVGNLVSLDSVPHYGFESNPSFGSGRGYIWSRTFPLLKDTILLGHGADTYPFYFPQNDYAGKYNAGWQLNMIIDKPHNMYLGIAEGTGMLSLVALIGLWMIYAVQSLVIYLRKPYRSFTSFAGVGIFLGVCGFLVSAVVNDSSVSTMPMFYGLLGTGIAINSMLKAEMAPKAKEES